MLLAEGIDKHSRDLKPQIVTSLLMALSFDFDVCEKVLVDEHRATVVLTRAGLTRGKDILTLVHRIDNDMVSATYLWAGCKLPFTTYCRLDEAVKYINDILIKRVRT